METASHGDGDDFVMVGREDCGELADAIRVAAFGEADEDLAADAQNVAALERAGERDVLELTKFGNGFGERRGFRTARCGAKWEDDGELIQDDGGILYKHGIREIQLGGERNDADAEFFQKLLVGAMLRARDLEIDGLARNE